MLDKFKAFLADKKAKIAAAIAGGATALTTSVSAFAADAGADGSDVTSGITTIFNQIKGSVSISQVVAIIGISLGTCIGLFLFWWGVRYIKNKVGAAATSGKLKV